MTHFLMIFLIICLAYPISSLKVKNQIPNQIHVEGSDKIYQIPPNTFDVPLSELEIYLLNVSPIDILFNQEQKSYQIGKEWTANEIPRYINIDLRAVHKITKVGLQFSFQILVSKYHQVHYWQKIQSFPILQSPFIFQSSLDNKSLWVSYSEPDNKTLTITNFNLQTNSTYQFKKTIDSGFKRWNMNNIQHKLIEIGSNEFFYSMIDDIKQNILVFFGTKSDQSLASYQINENPIKNLSEYGMWIIQDFAVVIWKDADTSSIMLKKITKDGIISSLKIGECFHCYKLEVGSKIQFLQLQNGKFWASVINGRQNNDILQSQYVILSSNLTQVVEPFTKISEFQQYEANIFAKEFNSNPTRLKLIMKGNYSGDKLISFRCYIYNIESKLIEQSWYSGYIQDFLGMLYQEIQIIDLNQEVHIIYYSARFRRYLHLSSKHNQIELIEQLLPIEAKIVSHAYYDSNDGSIWLQSPYEAYQYKDNKIISTFKHELSRNGCLRLNNQVIQGVLVDNNLVLQQLQIKNNHFPLQYYKSPDIAIVVQDEVQVINLPDEIFIQLNNDTIEYSIEFQKKDQVKGITYNSQKRQFIVERSLQFNETYLFTLQASTIYELKTTTGRFQVSVPWILNTNTDLDNTGGQNNNSQSTTYQSNQSTKKLSGAQIAGIVIGSLGVFILLCYLLCYLTGKKADELQNESETQSNQSEINDSQMQFQGNKKVITYIRRRIKVNNKKPSVVKQSRERDILGQE